MASINRAAVIWTTGIVAFAIGIAALGGDLAEPAPEIDSSEIPRDIVEFNNAFAIDFYRQISDNDDNIFFSPAGVYVTLSALYEGAGGNTASQIQDAIGLEPYAPPRHDAIARMMTSIKQNDPNIELGMENVLWMADRFAPDRRYADIVRYKYLADAQTVSFSDDGPGRINDWAADKTGGRITDVIDDTDSSTSMVITSAAHFEGTWATEFPIKDTRRAGFWIDGNRINADYMRVANYFDAEEFILNRTQVLRIPYEGDRLSMLIIVPYTRGELAALEEMISAQLIEFWLDGIRSMGMSIYIPKFEIEADYDLVPHLKALGVTDAFEPGAANLTGIVHAAPDGSLHVSGATHNAYIRISEEGAEEPPDVPLSSIYSPDIPRIVSFSVDEPFIFTIYDEESRLILFMGRVSDPTA